jgi:hypothetical protein
MTHTCDQKLIDKKIPLTKDIMLDCLKLQNSKKKEWFKSGKKIIVTNRMQKNYEYKLMFYCMNSKCEME